MKFNREISYVTFGKLGNVFYVVPQISLVASAIHDFPDHKWHGLLFAFGVRLMNFEISIKAFFE